MTGDGSLFTHSSVSQVIIAVVKRIVPVGGVGTIEDWLFGGNVGYSLRRRSGRGEFKLVLRGVALESELSE